MHTYEPTPEPILPDGMTLAEYARARHAILYPDQLPEGATDYRPADPAKRDALAAQVRAQLTEQRHADAERHSEARAGWRAVRCSVTAAAAPAFFRRIGATDPNAWTVRASAAYCAEGAAGQRAYLAILAAIDTRAEARLLADAARYGDPLPPIYAAALRSDDPDASSAAAEWLALPRRDI